MRKRNDKAEKLSQYISMPLETGFCARASFLRFDWVFWPFLAAVHLPEGEEHEGFLGVAEGYGPSCYQWGRDGGGHTYPVNSPNVGT